MLDSIESLSLDPFRTPATHEDGTLRQLVYGNKPHLYRIVYFVDESKKQVEILHVRHHSRTSFNPEDLE